MLLTPKEVRYIQISDAILKDKLTIARAAELFNVSDSCVNSAIRWAKDHRVTNLEASDDLKHTIAGLQKRLDWLEKQRRMKERESAYTDKNTGKRKKLSISATWLVVYLRESRALELAIAELKGIYKRALDINVKADITTRHIDYAQLSDDDLYTIRRLQEKAHVHGSN